MAGVIKRNRSSTKADLLEALKKLSYLLLDQKENDAVNALQDAAAKLEKASDNSPAAQEAVSQIIEAFEGEHELMAYTLTRESDEWTEAEELSQASSRVLNLARRMQAAMPKG